MSKNPEEKTLLNHLFYFIPVRELEEYRSQVSDINYKSKKGKRKIHQIFNNPSKGSGLYDRQFSCLCDSCMSGNFKNCIYLKDSQGCNSFSNCSDVNDPKWHVFSNTIDTGEDEFMDEYDNDFSGDTFIETEASLLVKQGDIAIVKTSDDYPYYLVKLI